MKKNVLIIGIIVLFTLSCSIFFSINTLLAVEDNAGQTLPDLVPLPAPKPEPPHLNDPPKTYAGQVILKYTQNRKESPRGDGLPSDEKTLTVNVAGTIYPEYALDYRNDMIFTGTYLFKEGQMSWSYNERNYEIASCGYLFTSVGSGNIDIAHTEKIDADSKILVETDGEYTLDINNFGRLYLTGDGLPIVGGDYNSAVKPVQTTTLLTSGDLKFCSDAGAITNEVPPEIYIRLENIKVNKNILSGSEVIHSTDNSWKTYTLTEMISYTIELPPITQDEDLEQPSISNDNPNKQGLLEIFFNWIRNLFE